MSKIVFNDGTEIENAVINSLMLPVKLVCEIPGDDLINAIALFSDTNKTREIKYYNMNLYKIIYKNYTHIDSVSVLHDINRISVTLSGEQDTDIIDGYSLPDEYIPGKLAEEIFSNQREEQQNNE